MQFLLEHFIDKDYLKLTHKNKKNLWIECIYLKISSYLNIITNLVWIVYTKNSYNIVGTIPRRYIIYDEYLLK